MGRRIQVLVVDDSKLARDFIADVLSRDEEIAVVGTAKNGREAVDKVQALKPDIVTIDIEMPVMNGLEAIERIMATNALPILVVTTRGDAHTAYAAISKGALDVVMKPGIQHDGACELLKKVKLLSQIKTITHLEGRRSARRDKAVAPSLFRGKTSDRAVAIASSTGGPDALSVVLSGLPGDFPCPVVVSQHNSDGFIPGMVEWLGKISKMPVAIAVEGEMVAPGKVYVSPSEKHMEITGVNTISLIERRPSDIYRPSCDRLLTSVARVYGARSIGVILTGMGSDGVSGIKAIKSSGGTTIAQDEKTSIVFGMPKAAIDAGCIEKILSLEEISGCLLRLVSSVRDPAGTRWTRRDGTAPL